MSTSSAPTESTRLEGTIVMEGTHPPFCQYFGHDELLTTDGATVSYQFIIDNVPETFVGKSRRDPSDAPDARIALCLAHSRALAKVGKVLAKRSAGYVKHADDMRDSSERAHHIREQLEAAIANARRREDQTAEDQARAVADIIGAETTPTETTPKPNKRVVLDRIGRMARAAKRVGEDDLANACIELADVVKRFDRLAEKAKERL